MADIQRWYDKSPKLSEMMQVLCNMPEKELSELSACLYQVVCLYRKQRNSSQEFVSLGPEKLFGYYKAYLRRRDYDQNITLMSAINAMSTLEIQEIEEIVDGFLSALREAGLYSLYTLRKKELEEKENT